MRVEPGTTFYIVIYRNKFGDFIRHWYVSSYRDVPYYSHTEESALAKAKMAHFDPNYPNNPIIYEYKAIAINAPV